MRQLPLGSLPDSTLRKWLIADGKISPALSFEVTPLGLECEKHRLLAQHSGKRSTLREKHAHLCGEAPHKHATRRIRELR